MTAGIRISAGYKGFLLFWMVCALAACSALAQGVTGSNSSHLRHVVLRPEAVPYEMERATWNLNQTNGPFLKEPELSAQCVFRRVLQFGKETNNAFALIWDQPRQKLYLDLNRNQDLTDDAAGVFASTNKSFSQRFPRVQLTLKTADGNLPLTFDLHLSGDSNAQWVQVQVVSHLLWQGRVTTAAQDWQVIVADQFLSGRGPAAGKYLVLRPWDQRTNRVYTTTSIWGTMEFPRRLSWMGQSYGAERLFETNGNGAVCKLILSPQQPPLVNVKLSGDYISYAVLHETNGYMLVLSGSEPSAKVPQGRYAVDAVWLKKGAAEAYRTERQPITLDARASTNLILGGPLTNWVTLERSGRKLLMNRELRGADGDIYNLTDRDSSRPPEFAVYRGGRKVFSGKFEFG